MIAGVPGAGISAFFYLLCVLAMPFVALRRTLAARSSRSGRWGFVSRHVAIGIAIAASLVAGGWAVSSVIPAAPQTQGAGGLEQVALQAGLALGRVGLLIGLATLGLVLGTVFVFAGLDSWRGRGRKRAGRQRLVARADLSAVWSTSAVNLTGRLSPAPMVLGRRPVARQTLIDAPVMRLPARASAEPVPFPEQVPAWSGGRSVRAAG
jgi:hypothetical protein